jgi:Zn-finger nucleic acid-binding protein
MKCPIDDTLLQISDRQGIEIDFCPQCRGVWLDRGELDKIIERAGVELGGSVPSAARPPSRGYGDDDRWRGERRYDDDDDHRRHGRYDDDHGYRYGKKKKRGGFLGDLFDFD